MRLGIDIGGTKIEGIILDESGHPVRRERISTEAQHGYSHILGQIERLFHNLTEGLNDVIFVGVCIPGALSATTDRLKKCTTQCLVDQPLKEDIEAIVGRSIEMDNDANCFAQAESTLGAAKGYAVVFGVIMGTGVGGGICINGQIHKGHHYNAGEWGHSLLYPGGDLCRCGKLGCVESYISGPALERHYTQLKGKKKPLKEIAKDPPPQWKKEFLENFGMSLSNIVNILDPDIIVLGGGVSNIDFLYSDGPKYVEKYCFNERLEIPIVKNKLGDSSGVFGAAYLEPLSSHAAASSP